MPHCEGQVKKAIENQTTTLVKTMHCQINEEGSLREFSRAVNQKNTGIDSTFIWYEARADPLSGIYDNKCTNTR